MKFPLDQWFDTSKKIDKSDADLAQVQMMLYAVKDGIDPESEDCEKEYKAMRSAVKKHNADFN